MKATKLITLGALMGAFSVASAEEAKPRERQVPAGLMEKFDTNKDGKLSEEERKAMREGMQELREKMRAEMLKKYDKDGDGELSEEERKTMKDEMEAKRKALVEKYDTNKNGKLDPEEAKAAREAGEEIPMMLGRGGPGGKAKKPSGDAAETNPAPVE